MREQKNYEAGQSGNNSGIGVRDGLTFLLIGGGIGAVLALLFAPKSGSELRSEIADVTRKGYDAAREKGNELKAKSADAIDTIKEKAEAAYGFAVTKLNRGDSVIDAVSETTKSVVDGLDQSQQESAPTSRQSGVGRKSASIF